MKTNDCHPQISSNYHSALRRLLGLVDFERMMGIGNPSIKQDLAKMEELMRRLNQPQKNIPSIHIAGTKGKGSVAAMISSVLVRAGFRVGLFTSPHIYNFRERIRLNNHPISEDMFARQLDHIWPIVMDMGLSNPDERPTTFETMTAMAFDLFRQQKVDVQVIEVGMGGRLDSTNVLNGDVAVITSLSLDHTAILGSTLSAVAKEKAGIIKHQAKVILAPQEPEALEVVLGKCQEQNAKIWQLGLDVNWHLKHFDLKGQKVLVKTPNASCELHLPLLGTHQCENAAIALAAIEALDKGVGPDAITQGISNVEWPGRFQLLSTTPYLVVDGAHNPYSIIKLCETVRQYFPNRKITVVFGCGAEKDLHGMVSPLAQLATRVIVCSSRHPKTVPVATLSEAFTRTGIANETTPNIATAIDEIRACKNSDELFLITGSLFVVAEALESWYGLTAERYPELEASGPDEIY